MVEQVRKEIFTPSEKKGVDIRFRLYRMAASQRRHTPPRGNSPNGELNVTLFNNQADKRVGPVLYVDSKEFSDRAKFNSIECICDELSMFSA